MNNDTSLDMPNKVQRTVAYPQHQSQTLDSEVIGFDISCNQCKRAKTDLVHTLHASMDSAVQQRRIAHSCFINCRSALPNAASATGFHQPMHSFCQVSCYQLQDRSMLLSNHSQPASPRDDTDGTVSGNAKASLHLSPTRKARHCLAFRKFCIISALPLCSC